MDERVLLAVVLGLLAIERANEVRLSRRNLDRLVAKGARVETDDGLAALVSVQLVLFSGTVIESFGAGHGGTHPGTPFLLAFALLLQAVRYWAISTLGERWCVRVVVLPGVPRIHSGPYRFFRHPNYLVVLLEPSVIPAAFGAFATALLATVLVVAALRRRVRVEDAALRRAQIGA